MTFPGVALGDCCCVLKILIGERIGCSGFSSLSCGFWGIGSLRFGGMFCFGGMLRFGGKLRFGGMLLFCDVVAAFGAQ